MAASVLRDAGFSVAVASNFKAARDLLDLRPALLVSDVRLGEFNGIHLALRAQGYRIPAIVIGEDDVVLQREAEKLGATYIARSNFERLVAAVVSTGVASSGAPDGGHTVHAA